MAASKSVIPEISVKSNLIIGRLDKATVGEVVTYAELNALVGGNVQMRERGNVNTAKRRELREGRVWETIANVGIKLMSGPEIVRTSDGSLVRVHRIAYRTAQKLLTVDRVALDETDRIKHRARLSHSSVLAEITKPKKALLLEAAVAQTERTLLLIETLEAFKGGHHEKAS